MLVLFKYAEMYTLIQITFSIYILYNNNSHYFSLLRHFIHIKHPILVSLQYLKKKQKNKKNINNSGTYFVMLSF